MENYNWREFVKRITVHTRPGDIYNAWTTQESLEMWFLSLAEFRTAQGVLTNRNETIKQGDRYKWLWFGYDDAFAEENEILSVNGKDRLDFVFSGGCLVTVTVKEEDGELFANSGKPCQWKVNPSNDISLSSVEKDGHFI